MLTPAKKCKINNKLSNLRLKGLKNAKTSNIGFYLKLLKLARMKKLRKVEKLQSIYIINRLFYKHIKRLVWTPVSTVSTWSATTPTDESGPPALGLPVSTELTTNTKSRSSPDTDDDK